MLIYVRTRKGKVKIKECALHCGWNMSSGGSKCWWISFFSPLKFSGSWMSSVTTISSAHKCKSRPNICNIFWFLFWIRIHYVMQLSLICRAPNCINLTCKRQQIFKLNKVKKLSPELNKKESLNFTWILYESQFPLTSKFSVSGSISNVKGMKDNDWSLEALQQWHSMHGDATLKLWVLEQLGS